MKTLKATILAFLVVLAFGAAKAKTVYPNTDDKTSVTYAVNTYVSAISQGKIKELNNLLDDNLKYSMERGSQKLVLDKAQYIESLKNNQNVEQDCLVTSTITESTPDVTLVKVEMKYAEFTRINYVTMVNSSKGWKITNIYSTFK